MKSKSTPNRANPDHVILTHAIDSCLGAAAGPRTMPCREKDHAACPDALPPCVLVPPCLQSADQRGLDRHALAFKAGNEGVERFRINSRVTLFLSCDARDGCDAINRRDAYLGPWIACSFVARHLLPESVGILLPPRLIQCLNLARSPRLFLSGSRHPKCGPCIRMRIPVTKWVDLASRTRASISALPIGRPDEGPAAPLRARFFLPRRPYGSGSYGQLWVYGLCMSGTSQSVCKAWQR